jgi:GT2 family glycosyltransferase
MKDYIISVVLGSYNRRRFLPGCIDSVRRELAELPHEIIVVDGGSTDGSVKWLAKQKDIITIIQHNHGFWRGWKLERRSWGYFMNLGFKAAQGKYICMISDDCLVIPEAIKNGVVLFENKLAAGKKVGALAFYWRDWPVENFYAVYTFVDNNIYLNNGLYLNSALQEVGYLDEDNYKFYAGDVDVCLKLQEAGYKIEAAEDSYIEHYAHANLWTRFKNNKQQEPDRLALIQKWSFRYGSDPARYTAKCIKKDFADPRNTIRRFYWLRFFSLTEHLLCLVKYLRKIIKPNRGS